MFTDLNTFAELGASLMSEKVMRAQAIVDDPKLLDAKILMKKEIQSLNKKGDWTSLSTNYGRAVSDLYQAMQKAKSFSKRNEDKLGHYISQFQNLGGNPGAAKDSGNWVWTANILTETLVPNYKETVESLKKGAQALDDVIVQYRDLIPDTTLDTDPMKSLLKDLQTRVAFLMEVVDTNADHEFENFKLNQQDVQTPFDDFKNAQADSLAKYTPTFSEGFGLSLGFKNTQTEFTKLLAETVATMETYKDIIGYTVKAEDKEKYPGFIKEVVKEVKKPTFNGRKDGSYLRTAASVVCSVVLLMNM